MEAFAFLAMNVLMVLGIGDWPVAELLPFVHCRRGYWCLFLSCSILFVVPKSGRCWMKVFRIRIVIYEGFCPSFIGSPLFPISKVLRADRDSHAFLPENDDGLLILFKTLVLAIYEMRSGRWSPLRAAVVFLSVFGS